MIKFNIFDETKEVIAICKSLCRHGFSKMDIYVDTPHGEIKVGTASFCSVPDLWETFSKASYYIRLGRREKNKTKRFVHLIDGIMEGVRLETLSNAFDVSPSLLLDLEDGKFLPEEQPIVCE
ncbi:MAG: hypothetical protein [Caudoviricetes sp.]|nr:MAG: hypothetical protein [Caudoviricetes sp.]